MAAAADRGSKLYRGLSSQSFLQLFRDFGRLDTSRPHEFLGQGVTKSLEVRRHIKSDEGLF